MGSSLTLLVKDHKKTWSVESGVAPPTRSIMGGNVGCNQVGIKFSFLCHPGIRADDFVWRCKIFHFILQPIKHAMTLLSNVPVTGKLDL